MVGVRNWWLLKDDKILVPLQRQVELTVFFAMMIGNNGMEMWTFTRFVGNNSAILGKITDSRVQF